MPAVSSRAATCISRVDFPIPGSPPTSVTEPGTMPPPKTKSNSSRPVFHRATATPCRSVSRIGAWPVRDGLTALPANRLTGSSLSVFHAPQASHRPAHFGCSAPQSVQRKTERPLDTRELWRDVSPGGIVESGEPLFEDQGNGASRSVALLADD